MEGAEQVNKVKSVGAVVLAAGKSRRMGQPKLVLPWGERTVIEQVVVTLTRAGVDEIVVVTGARQELVDQALSQQEVKTAHNPAYADGEMITSLQTGIRACSSGLDGLLIVLGDQPGMETEVVDKIVETFRTRNALIVMPSFQMRRGHPWLAARSLWDEILNLPVDQTLRTFLQKHESEITYVPVDHPSILKDLDTPEDYRLQQPDNTPGV